MSIFEHHHHHHDHGHEHHEDPAQQALADALKVCFRILKIVIVVMLILYCVSGNFSVDANEVAVRLRFGKMVKDSDGTVKVEEPGGPYFALPYPIHQVKRISKAPRKVAMLTQFWVQEGEGIAPTQGALNPEKDGSMLTGDANIIHARWSLTYQVVDPTKYLENVGTMQLADRLVMYAAEQGVVYIAAQTSADDMINGKVSRTQAIGHMQKILDGMGSGVKVTELSATHAVMPHPVRPAYEAVVNAEQEKGRLMEEARKERATILESVAGEAQSQLLKMIDEYEAAKNVGDEKRVAALNKTLESAFQNLNTGQDYDNRNIGGTVATVINGAKTYRTAVVESVKAEARRFEQLLPQYEANPRIVKSRIWNDAREQILSSENVELFYTRGQIYIETNRRPDIAADRERARLKAEQEQLQKDVQR